VHGKFRSQNAEKLKLHFVVRFGCIQEMRANAHETRDSISLVSYAGCLGKNNEFVGGVRGTPLWCPRSRGVSSPSGTKSGHIKLETVRYHTVKTRSLYLTCMAWIGTGSWQTARQTELR